MSEEVKEYLEIFHFTMKLVGEDQSFIDFYKDGLASLLKSKIKKVVENIHERNNSSLSEANFYTSSDYNNMLEKYKNQVKSILDSVKERRLYFQQGSGFIQGNPFELLKEIPNTFEPSIKTLQILRSIPSERISFLPEYNIFLLMLYRGTLSKDPFVRAFCFSELLDASSTLDANQYHTIIKELCVIWKENTVTIEFSGCIYHFLTLLSDVFNGILDDNIQNDIIDIVKEFILSLNFNMLFLYNSSLKWVYSILDPDSIVDMLSKSFKLIEKGCHALVCFVLTSILRGIGSHEHLKNVILISMNNISEWSQLIKDETRSLLGDIGAIIQSSLMMEILPSISDTLTSSDSIYVFAEFVVSFYVHSSSNFCSDLFLAVEGLISSGTISQDIDNMYSVICSSPIRFHSALGVTKNKALFSRLSHQNREWPSLYKILYDSHSTTFFSSKISDDLCRNLVKVQIDDDYKLSIYKLKMVLYVMMYPLSICALVKNINSLYEEHMVIVISVIASLSSSGESALCDEFLEELPNPRYVCEYTEDLNLIKKCLNNRSKYDCLREISNGVDISMGSKTLVQLSLLFEYVVYAEGGPPFVSLLRTRVPPAIWFSAIVSSRYSSLFEDPDVLIDIIKKCSEKPTYFVWYAIVFQRHLSSKWSYLLAEENFEGLARSIAYPLLAEQLSEDELSIVDSLEEKYAPIYQEIQKFTDPVFNR